VVYIFRNKIGFSSQTNAENSTHSSFLSTVLHCQPVQLIHAPARERRDLPPTAHGLFDGDPQTALEILAPDGDALGVVGVVVLAREYEPSGHERTVGRWDDGRAHLVGKRVWGLVRS